MSIGISLMPTIVDEDEQIPSALNDRFGSVSNANG